jgi:hypothetical protein
VTGSGSRWEPAIVQLLTDGAGRGYTVLCTVQDRSLLGALAAQTRPTGLLIVAGYSPMPDPDWECVRCDPARSIPIRSHVIDAAVLVETADMTGLAEETRRVLVPGGDVRVLTTDDSGVEDALSGTSIRTVRTDGRVLIARGP